MPALLLSNLCCWRKTLLVLVQLRAVLLHFSLQFSVVFGMTASPKVWTGQVYKIGQSTASTSLYKRLSYSFTDLKTRADVSSTQTKA